MSNKFLKWWLLFVLQLIALGVAGYYGLHTYIIEHDQTYITFVLLVIWLFTSLKIGHRIFRQSDSSDEGYWFVAETSMSIGMVGTVLGFIMMLDGSNLGDIDPNDIDAMKAVIGQLAGGMGTALLTTLAGLVTAISLRTQLIMNDDTKGDD